jgi:hypothetical protein
MTTLEISIEDDLIKLFGLERIKSFIDEALAYERFRMLEMEIIKALTEAKDVNWESEFEHARQDAYQEYLEKRNVIV